MTTKMTRRPAVTTGPAWPPDLASRLRIPRSGAHVPGRRRLAELLDRAIRRRVTLVCAPAGAGKTIACSAWAAMRSRKWQIIWVTLRSEADQAWCWPGICSGLRQSSAVPTEAARYLEDGPAGAFPLRLAAVARAFTEPVVVVFDNMDFVTDAEVLRGLDFLARYAPPTLRLVLCARQPPGLHLDRLRASGDLAEIGAADLAAVAP